MPTAVKSVLAAVPSRPSTLNPTGRLVSRLIYSTHVATAPPSLIDTDELPNTLVRSTAVGFTHPASFELLNDFVQQYFDMLLPIWESRSYQIAQYLIVGLFPAPLASISLRNATRAWLAANKDAAPALRRLVGENLAGVERALLVQERDAQ